MEMKRSRKWPRMEYSLEGMIKHVELFPHVSALLGFHPKAIRASLSRAYFLPTFKLEINLLVDALLTYMITRSKALHLIMISYIAT